MMPNFSNHYNQGYDARPAPIIVKPTTGFIVKPATERVFCASAGSGFMAKDTSDSELAIHEEIARAKEPRFVLRAIDTNRYYISHSDPIEQHFFWEAKFREEIERFEQHQSRAYQGLLQSALGFEPTEHSDAPPYIPTTPTAKPKPCVDFGFEPTEASE